MKTFEMKAKHGRISSEKSTFISFIAIFRKKLGALTRAQTTTWAFIFRESELADPSFFERALKPKSAETASFLALL
jgi:hypothetical protein